MATMVKGVNQLRSHVRRHVEQHNAIDFNRIHKANTCTKPSEKLNRAVESMNSATGGIHRIGTRSATMLCPGRAQGPGQAGFISGIWMELLCKGLQNPIQMNYNCRID
jgi:hypothetical protein